MKMDLTETIYGYHKKYKYLSVIRNTKGEYVYLEDGERWKKINTMFLKECL